MVKVCAWCQKYLGIADSKDPLSISHGICPACVARQQLEEMPTLVIPEKWAETLPLMEALLRGTPEIPVVVERRVGNRRRSHAPSDEPEDRRRLLDRRRSDGMLLI
ncbi:MAG TPA: hypothetical protein VN375_20950 [Vicinamibacteria bacterium]|nr:hypothetical protein [Vicinamibacteria bacterium]